MPLVDLETEISLARDTPNAYREVEQYFTANPTIDLELLAGVLCDGKYRRISDVAPSNPERVDMKVLADLQCHPHNPSSLPRLVL